MTQQKNEPLRKSPRKRTMTAKADLLRSSPSRKPTSQIPKNAPPTPPSQPQPSEPRKGEIAPRALRIEREMFYALWPVIKKHILEAEEHLPMPFARGVTIGALDNIIRAIRRHADKDIVVPAVGELTSDKDMFDDFDDVAVDAEELLAEPCRMCGRGSSRPFSDSQATMVDSQTKDASPQSLAEAMSQGFGLCDEGSTTSKTV